MNCGSCESMDYSKPIDDSRYEMYWCKSHCCYKDPYSIVAYYSCDNYKDSD